MPTADDYMLLAARFDERADALTVLPTRFATAITSDILVGPYHELIDDALGVSGRNLANAAVDLRRLASICRSRASVCRAHTRAVNRYWHARRDPDSRSPLPNYPSAPRWAEYG